MQHRGVSQHSLLALCCILACARLLVGAPPPLLPQPPLSDVRDPGCCGDDMAPCLLLGLVVSGGHEPLWFCLDPCLALFDPQGELVLLEVKALARGEGISRTSSAADCRNRPDASYTLAASLPILLSPTEQEVTMAACTQSATQAVGGMQYRARLPV